MIGLLLGRMPLLIVLVLVASSTISVSAGQAPAAVQRSAAAAADPSLEDPDLGVRPVVSGLTTPTAFAFIGANDFLVLEKNTGRVRRVANGVLQPDPVLQLAVNFFSERGLLGIALHPDFPATPWVYLYWSQSLTGVTSGDAAEVPLLGNRVDRYRWNGTTLEWDRNLIRLHAFQADGPDQPIRGNHDGGVIIFDPRGRSFPDGKAKLFIVIGDNGRRGQMQNLPDGPFQNVRGDDQFGGPEPDNAHFTGVVIRLNEDGTTPTDNPFFALGAGLAAANPEVGANIQRIFAYGVRNSFGMTFDRETADRPDGPQLWLEENGSDSFDKLSRVEAGANDGWIQSMGPLERVQDYKAIESSIMPPSVPLQQRRWPPSRIADTPQEALDRMFMLPGAHYNSPKFSWLREVPPAGIGFLESDKLGGDYRGNLFMGAATAGTLGGHLFRFTLTPDRMDVEVPYRVAENSSKHDLTGSEFLLFGTNFGIVPDIKTASNGNLYVVSLDRGTIYEIFRRPN